MAHSLFYFLTLFVDDLFTWKNIPFGIVVMICICFGLAREEGWKAQMCVTAIGAALGAGVFMRGW